MKTVFFEESARNPSQWAKALENLKKAKRIYEGMRVVPDSYWLRRAREALARLEVEGCRI